jgi:hypothetical protein
MNIIIQNNFEQFCIDGDYEKINEYLTYYKWLANHNDGEYFEIVANNGRLDLIKLFIENGADVHANDDYALYTCSYHKYGDCVEYLINNGANIEKK